MNKQDDLRKQIKIFRATDEEWTYKMIAQAIGMSQNAFYNWLSGFYDLGYKKAKDLENLLSDLTD